MPKLLAIAFFLIGISGLVKAQSGATKLVFSPTYYGKSIQPGKAIYVSELQDSVSLDDFRFYISEAKFISPDGSIFPFSKHHFLCDFQHPESLQLACPPIISNESESVLWFQIGIDSTTSSSGAFGQDLDPVHGMYWAWNSGYINVKIQGQSPKCPARNHQFEYHLGGYLVPNNAITSIQRRIIPGKDIQIEIELSTFFKDIDIQKEYQIMSPSKRAVELSQVFSSCFQIKQ